MNNQRGEIEDLSRQLQETEQRRLRDKGEMENKQVALEVKLERLLGRASTKRINMRLCYIFLDGLMLFRSWIAKCTLLVHCYSMFFVAY